MTDGHSFCGGRFGSRTGKEQWPRTQRPRAEIFCNCGIRDLSFSPDGRAWPLCERSDKGQHRTRQLVSTEEQIRLAIYLLGKMGPTRVVSGWEAMAFLRAAPCEQQIL